MCLQQAPKLIWGYHGWDSANNMLVNNAIDTFDVLMCKNIYDD